MYYRSDDWCQAPWEAGAAEAVGQVNVKSWQLLQQTVPMVRTVMTGSKAVKQKPFFVTKADTEVADFIR